jgi:HK97 gp10 family phage protein
MAKFSFSMPEEFIEKIEKMSDIDKIAPKMIDEATPIVVESIRKNLASHKDTGDLDESVKAKKSKKMRNGGYYGRVSFEGYGSTDDHVPNMIKAIALEYGSTQQDAQPFMDKSVKDVEQEVYDKMQDVFDKEVGET